MMYSMVRVLGAMLLSVYLVVPVGAVNLPGQGPGSWYGSTDANHLDAAHATDVVNVVVYGNHRGLFDVRDDLQESNHGWGETEANGVYGKRTSSTDVRTQEYTLGRGDFGCTTAFCRNHIRMWANCTYYNCTNYGPNTPTIIMASYEVCVEKNPPVSWILGCSRHEVRDFNSAARDVSHDIQEGVRKRHNPSEHVTQAYFTPAYGNGSIRTQNRVTVQYSGQVAVLQIN